jgi:ribosomal protein S18 acetylase RimI-like enzyme
MNDNSDIIIRDARPDERQAIASLTQEAYAEYASIMEPRAWEALRGAVTSGLASDLPVERIVADDKGALVGSVMLFPPETNAYGAFVASSAVPELRLLAVAPSARGMGVGQALTTECIRRARVSGATALGLHTSKSEVVAIGLYERLGFTRYPAEDFQPDGAELVMAYRLLL